MKKILSALFMLLSANAFAGSAADESNRALAEMKSACANNSGSGCYQAMQANDAASKRLLVDAFVTQPQARQQHEQEVIRDEQLRQRVRQRGY